jgi:hypothetical protein
MVMVDWASVSGEGVRLDSILAAIGGAGIKGEVERTSERTQNLTNQKRR